MKKQCGIGSMTPQLLIQITPLCWALALMFDKNQLAFSFGPLSMKIFWRIPKPLDWRCFKGDQEHYFFDKD